MPIYFTNIRRERTTTVLRSQPHSSELSHFPYLCPSHIPTLASPASPLPPGELPWVPEGRVPRARPLQLRGRRCSLAGGPAAGPDNLQATHSTTLLTGGPAASASYAPAKHLSVANLSPTLMKMRRSYQPELHDPFPWAGQER